MLFYQNQERMLNLYLHNPSYVNVGIAALEQNLKELNNIVCNSIDSDLFFINESIYEIKIDHNIDFSQAIYEHIDPEFRVHALPRLLCQIQTISHVVETLDDFPSSKFPYNAFYVVLKQNTDSIFINSLSDYILFKKKNFINIAPSLFWDHKKHVFRRILFCDNVKNYITSLGTSKYLPQIIKKILELNDYIERKWTNGGFYVNNINAETSLNISDESESTLNNPKLKDKRMYVLPDSKNSVCFSLHIKTGNFRIHFYPDVLNHVIYIGYIGPHLETTKFK